jgi:hypothetical protein
MINFFRPSAFVPFRCFWGDVRREFMRRISVVLDATLSLYLRDAL